MEYPHSNCSTVAAVARQLGKDMQFVNLFRNTVDFRVCRPIAIGVAAGEEGPKGRGKKRLR